ncbi:hypothetical protein I6E61_06025 [Psychrobacter sp. NZS113]|uniref:hypothetical protein n=1 Tax=Psychrobacter sp. NZS113 TaxID=2792045 RepID=UPI0018CF911E|nr:hypothetical protein [Psychrobacter sp. NZS113]MBH0095945.1 hypothetical protein [Psychrobacter sp. NZS113]
MGVIKFQKKEYEVVTSCEHNIISIDRSNKSITCRDCKEVLDPFNAIMDYSDALDDYKKRLDKYADEAEKRVARNNIVARRLESRKRTKCHHCNKITEINIKEPTLFDVHAEMQGR